VRRGVRSSEGATCEVGKVRARWVWGDVSQGQVVVSRGGGGGEWVGGDWVGGWWVGGGDHNKGWVGNDTPDDAFGLGSDAVLVSSGCATVGYPLAVAAAVAPAPAAAAPAAGVGAVSSAPTVGSAALACEQHPPHLDVSSQPLSTHARATSKAGQWHRSQHATNARERVQTDEILSGLMQATHTHTHAHTHTHTHARTHTHTHTHLRL
jgi:hypothetical protein